MPEENEIQDEEFNLIIDFSNQHGVVPAGSGDSLEKLKKESERALNITMGVIRSMTDKFSKTISAIEEEVRPHEMEIGFSLKLDLESGVVVPMVVKTNAGGQFDIKFKWYTEGASKPKVLVSKKN